MLVTELKLLGVLMKKDGLNEVELVMTMGYEEETGSAIKAHSGFFMSNQFLDLLASAMIITISTSN
jgi:hypothetical protein